MNNTDIAAQARDLATFLDQGIVSTEMVIAAKTLRACAAAVEASARQLAEQPGHLLIAAERWAQLEHMWSRNATPETIASYIGRPEILDRISKIRREHEAAVQGNAA